MDPASFLPAGRYNYSPQRLEYERERSPIDISDAQYLNMIKMNEGNSQGNILKATAYINGIFGFKQNFKEALRYFTLAAEQGNALGMYNLGIIHSQGVGVRVNFEEAIKWWEKAAGQEFEINGSENDGVKQAEAALGNAYACGQGVEKNGALAIQYWERSAKHGYDVALNNLGAEHEHGRLAPKDISKAKMYYNAAAMKGAETAMYNLGLLEISTGNEEVGMKWLKKAASNKHPLAEQAIRNMAKRREGKETSEDVNDLINKCLDMNMALQKNNSNLFIYRSSQKERYSMDQLVEYAPKSKIAASLLKAKCASVEALLFLEEEKSDILVDVTKMRKFASLAAECYKITETVMEFYSQSMKALVFQVFRKLHKLEPNNVDAMLGLLFDPQVSTREIELWISKGKKVPRIFETLSLIYLMKQNFPESLHAINNAIKMEPSYTHYFVRGSIYRMTGNTREANNDFDTFLREGDPEDRKIPNAYFGKVQHYIAVSDITKAEEAFALGCQKDEEALPFFRKQEATQKDATKSLLEFARAAANLNNNKAKKQTQPEKAKRKPVEKFSSEWEKKYQDIRRIEIVTNFRKVVRSVKNAEENEKTSAPARKQQPLPSNLDNLTPIFVEDMERKDKVYEGFVLSCKIIEQPAVLAGTYTLIEDDHGQVQKVGFYNFGIKNYKQAQEKFWIGKQISIVNPYMRIGMSDNEPYIRVEHEECVITYPHDRYSACALCQSSSVTKCSRCGTTYYCSKRCQEIDWKTFNHKSICEPKKP